jgi:hypothetical protein
MLVLRIRAGAGELSLRKEQRLQRLVHLLAHPRAHGIERVIYLRAERGTQRFQRLVRLLPYGVMHVFEQVINGAFQRRAQRLDHVIGLLVSHKLDLLTEVRDHRLEHRGEWLMLGCASEERALIRIAVLTVRDDVGCRSQWTLPPSWRQMSGAHRQPYKCPPVLLFGNAQCVPTWDSGSER